MKKILKKVEKQDYISIAVKILEEEKIPLKFNDLADKILKNRTKEVGKTPKKSIYSAFLRTDKIIKNPDGKYALKDWI